MHRDEYRRLVTLCLLAIVSGMAFFTGCSNEPPRLLIKNARVEFSEAMRDEASVFLTIQNDGGKDTLIGARTSIPGALADIHEMRGSVMVLSKALPVPAKGNLDLASGSSHVMLEGIPADVNLGYHFTLTLVFKKSGEIQVPLVITKPRALPQRRS
ncbi:MAG TPA: copper chaperone PCu(A)C [Nitrospirota bacterium]|nr:copper chaperone PCu(A)C [Nitrospirota bacterium]